MRLACFIALSVGILFAGNVLGQQVFRPAGAKWQVTLPATWKVAPPTALKQLQDEREVGENVALEDPFFIIAKFDPAKGMGIGYPYIVVQHLPNEEIDRATWSDFMSDYEAVPLDAGLVGKSYRFIAPTLTDSQYVGCEASATYYARLDAEGAGPSGRTIRVYYAGFLAKGDLYEIGLYDKLEEKDRYMGDFDAIVASFQLDPDARWVPGPGFPEQAPATRSSSRSIGFPRFGLLGIGGIGVGLIALIVRRIVIGNS